MDQPPAMREATRIFRLLLVIQLAVYALSFFALLGLSSQARLGLLLRAIPTLVLALLFVPPWLEESLGRYFLALGLGLDVFFSSIQTAYLFAGGPISGLVQMGFPADLVEQFAAAPPVEPFFFLLIPLVLLAWGYGQNGALLGSTWAALLHLAAGLWLSPSDALPPFFVAQTLVRIALLYMVPLIVSILSTKQRQQHSQLEAAHQRLRRHAATVEQLAISRERNRLARELHDTLAHSLSALTVQLQALRSLLAHDPKAAEEAVDEIASLARHGLEESRQAILALRTDPVETLGLAGALRDELQSLQARTGVQSDLVIAGQDPDLTLEEAQTLFRIAEEALSNVERHAAAQQVNVRLACGSDRIDLVVLDDGHGFDPADVNSDRYGLTGMRERAALIGASLDVRSRGGVGTEVWCTLQR